MQTLTTRATYGNGDIIGLVAVVVPEGMTGKGLLRLRRQEQARIAKAQEQARKRIARETKARKRIAKQKAAAKKKALKSTMTLKQVKRGDYFKLVNIVDGVVSFTKTVYVKGSYNRSTKKFDFWKFDDINATRELPGTRPVTIDFEF